MEDDYLEIFDELNEEQKSKCRLCANEEPSKYLINIFGSEGRKYALDIKIRKCLPISVREDDGMPNGICMTCLNKLEVSVDLVDSCLRAHNSFLSLMVHDPARAKVERFTTFDDDDDQHGSDNEPGIDSYELDQSSETGTVEPLDNHIVIKGEPMDLEDDIPTSVISDEVDEREMSNLNHIDEAMMLAESSQHLVDDREQGSMANVIVSAVNSMAPSPSIQSNLSHASSHESLSDNRAMERSNRQGLTDYNDTSYEVTIKDEPLNSPPHTGTFSPLPSESPLLDNPDTQENQYLPAESGGGNH